MQRNTMSCSVHTILCNFARGGVLRSFLPPPFLPLPFSGASVAPFSSSPLPLRLQRYTPLASASNLLIFSNRLGVNWFGTSRGFLLKRTNGAVHDPFFGRRAEGLIFTSMLPCLDRIRFQQMIDVVCESKRRESALAMPEGVGGRQFGHVGEHRIPYSARTFAGDPLCWKHFEPSSSSSVLWELGYMGGGWTSATKASNSAPRS